MKSFLWKIYAYRFLEAFKLIGVIFTLLFQHNGLSTFEISILITVWSATQLTLEVPLGVFADKYPRRNLLIIALLFLIVGYLFWIKGGFIFYAIGFILWGVKNALTSGTLEAFVYDELKAFNAEEQYEKINGRLETAFWLGVTISAILGGLAASINYNLVLLISIIFAVFAIISLALIKPVQPIKSTNESNYYHTLKKALGEIKNNSKLLEIVIFFCLVFATYGAADEYWALIYQRLGSPTALIGTLIAAGYGLFAIAGYVLHLFKSNKIKNVGYFLIITSGILFIISGFINSMFSILFIFLAMFILKVAHIKYDAKFQHSIESGERATISSLKSLIFEIVYMGFVLLFGFMATRFGTMIIPYILGAMLVLWTILSKLFFKDNLEIS